MRRRPLQTTRPEIASEIELGYVSGIFGVRGEVRLFVHNRDSELLANPRKVILLGPDEERRAVSMRCRGGAGGRVIARIDGVQDRDAAAALRDWRIVVSTDDLPKLPDSEFYLRDVLGCPVRIGERALGMLADVHQSGPVDVLEIRRDGDEPLYVPALAVWIAAVASEGITLTAAAAALE